MAAVYLAKEESQNNGVGMLQGVQAYLSTSAPEVAGTGPTVSAGEEGAWSMTAESVLSGLPVALSTDERQRT